MLRGGIFNVCRAPGSEDYCFRSVSTVSGVNQEPATLFKFSTKGRQEMSFFPKPFKHEGRARKNSTRVGAKRKSWRRSGDPLCRGEKEHQFLQGSQAMPARPPHKDKMSDVFRVVSSRNLRRRQHFSFLINVCLNYNLKI